MSVLLKYSIESSVLNLIQINYVFYKPVDEADKAMNKYEIAMANPQYADAIRDTDDTCYINSIAHLIQIVN